MKSQTFLTRNSIFGLQAYLLPYKALVPRFRPSSSFALRSTHSEVVRLTLFVSINVFKAVMALVFVMESAGLLSSFIHLTSVIFRRSYDWRRLMISIISRFLLVVPSLTRHLYNDFESVQMTIGTSYWRTWKSVAFNTTPMSKPWAIAYNSEASTLLVTCLHLIED